MKTIIALIFLVYSSVSSANSWWHSLWSRPLNSEWQGVENYRNGHYKEAARVWEPLKSSLSYYNQGNALAHLGDYPGAIKSYENALKREPDHKDAAYNKALLEKLMQQQKQEQQQQSSNQDQQKNKNGQDKQDKNDQKDNKKDKNKDDAKSSPQQKQQAADKQKAAAKKQEKQQADQQWLKQVPDDPGGLLQHKFWRDHQRYQQQGYFED